MNAPNEILRSDYRPSPWTIERVELRLELARERTLVHAVLHGRRTLAAAAPLLLDGVGLETLDLRLDGVAVPVVLDDGRLRLEPAGETCVVASTVAIAPAANGTMSGLYASGAILCTQCEAEGFRRITWFLDRPDIMATFRVVLEAERAAFPVLLSNGNRLATEELPDGRQRVTWDDPSRKPCYLFAVVAGDLRCVAGQHVRPDGRPVQCEVWVDPGNEAQADHALRSLILSMRWDEQRFGRVYDLDLYMIVAVRDFNMGAMENKGLNIFNAKYVLASPETATDDEYEAVQAVIAHEYFHNWTGNRITCRDWFQLTLKEGLTVYRDQRFTADHTDPATKRIRDVQLLRTHQFPEDRGPMAHAVRPERYAAIDNFYTVTVYEKGAEVVRLYETRFGIDGFRRGMDLYFQRHDGQAVTCDDFRAALADANGADLTSWEGWYRQAGTPRLAVSWTQDAATLRLELRQHRGDLAGHPPYEALPIPVRLAILDADGRRVALRRDGVALGDEAVLMLERASETWTFDGVPAGAVPSVLRQFSAPVILELHEPSAAQRFRAAHDDDPFNRFDAVQELAHAHLASAIAAVQAGQHLPEASGLIAVLGGTLADERLSPAFRALCLNLPGETLLAERLSIDDPDAVAQAREGTLRVLAEALAEPLENAYRRHLREDGAPGDPAAVGDRRFAHACLAILARHADGRGLGLARRQYRAARTMTCSKAALGLLAWAGGVEGDDALQRFYDRWRNDPLILDAWFSLQALSAHPQTMERIEALRGHPDFSLANPNRARSLIGTCSGNRVVFHRRDGRGYRFVADAIAELDRRNPQLASRLATAFNPWRRQDSSRQTLIRAELQRLAARPDLSRDLGEVVHRALG